MFQHRFLTSNTTNETELWKSVCRLIITAIVVKVFLKELELTDWYDGLVALYFSKVVIPVGGAAFVLCGVTDAFFEFIGLLNKDFSKKYVSYIHTDTVYNINDPKV